MAAAIPEAVEVASSAGSTAAGAGAAREIKPSRIPAKNRPPFGPEPEGPRRPRAQALPAPGQDRRESSGQRRQGQARNRARRAARGASRARLPGSHSYQPVILAEFLVAVVVVAVSPLAKPGGTSEAQAKGSPSPYSTNTLKQLVAIGGVYFVLALLGSSQRAGRLAAWFGGLVLLGLGLLEYASGDLQSLFGIFGPSATAAPPIPSTSSPQANPNLPGITTPGAPGAGIPGVGQDIGVNTTTQSVTFSQPGVATTTETSPGVTVNGSSASAGTGIARSGGGGVVRSPQPGLG